MNRNRISTARYAERLLWVAALCIASASAFTLSARPAHADPHALFYTAVGQRQLFFNVLAALDQADYVETVDQRAQLETRRDNARTNPKAGSEDAIAVTKTDLSTILTRQVTLEGQDLFTAYEELQLATEAKRRKDFDRVIRILCTISAGREDCANGKEKNAGGEETEPDIDTDQAYTTNTQDLEAQRREGGLGALASYDVADTPDQIARQKKVESKDTYKLPRPYDTEVAQLRNNIKNTNDSTNRTRSQNALNNIVSTIAGSTNDAVDPDVYNRLEFHNNGTITARPTKVTNAPITSITTALSSLASAPFQLYSTYLRGKAQVAAVQNERFAGHVPNTKSIPEGRCTDTGCSVDSGATYKSVGVEISAPAAGKYSAQAAGFSELANSTIGQITTDPTAESESGTIPAASQRGAATAPGVAGATSTNQQDAAGNVAGIIDLTNPKPDEKKLDADDLLINPAEEQGPIHFLEAFGFKTGHSEGCGCSLGGSVSSHSGAVAGAIARRR